MNTLQILVSAELDRRAKQMATSDDNLSIAKAGVLSIQADNDRLHAEYEELKAWFDTSTTPLSADVPAMTQPVLDAHASEQMALVADMNAAAMEAVAEPAVATNAADEGGDAK